MKDVYIKDPISMLIPIRSYFVTHSSHFFLPPLSLSMCSPSITLVYLCSPAPFHPLQYLLECSVYLVCWHFFFFWSMCAPISSLLCPSFTLLPFFVRFLSVAWVHQMPDSHTSSSPRIWFLFPRPLACLLLSSWLSSVLSLFVLHR